MLDALWLSECVCACVCAQANYYHGVNSRLGFGVFAHSAIIYIEFKQFVQHAEGRYICCHLFACVYFYHENDLFPLIRLFCIANKNVRLLHVGDVLWLRLPISLFRCDYGSSAIRTLDSGNV